MRYIKSFIPVFIFLSIFQLHYGQLIPSPDLPAVLQTDGWPASWVNASGRTDHQFKRIFFRNDLVIDEIPGSFVIHISADNRYRLYINGELKGFGPAKSDIDHWIFDTYDIAKDLVEGDNIIAVEVLNYGHVRPVSFISGGTRFLCQGNGPAEQILNTPGNWKMMEDPSIEPEPVDREKIPHYFVVPPGEKFICALYPWQWKNPGFDDSDWEPVITVSRAFIRGNSGDLDYALAPRLIPAMQLEKGTDPVIRLSNGENPLSGAAPIKDINIPAHSVYNLLLDNRVLVNAYPNLIFSGGKGGMIKITYAESLYDDNGAKGNRDSIAGKSIKGYSDVIIPDGGERRNFFPMWFRTFRYVLVEIKTDEEPINLHSFENFETGYPFEEKGYFRSSDPRIDELWNAGWRTLRLCSGETFYDCPYYEQLQYVGDTRIEALVSIYTSGDDRLMRKAITDFYNSILPEGLTQSRYPSDPGQVIPTYSLFWISMINDYLWNRPDYEFVFNFLVPMQNIITWFEKRIDDNTGMLGPIDFWPFVDWTGAWRGNRGVPEAAYSGSSSIITLQFVMALQQAAEIFNFYGYEDIGKSYAERANELSETTFRLCWDENRGYMADSPSRKSFSQHAIALSVLTNAIPEDRQALVIDRAINDESLIKTTYYFSYYLHEAMVKTGLGNKYLDQLGPWHSMIARGLTTFAEKPEPTRSDCHAWSASPLLELLRTTAGIKPGGYGFESVIIEPHPGNLDWIKASVPHYLGNIELDLRFTDSGEARGTIVLPGDLEGIFIWNGTVTDLKAGRQKVGAKSINNRIKLE